MNAKLSSKLLWMAAIIIALTATLFAAPSPAAAAGPWIAQYYNNSWLGGRPVFTRGEASIAYDWGTGSPDARIPADGFSARWTSYGTFNSGWYRFSATADDGVRVYLDGVLIIDQWHSSAGTTYNVDRLMVAGQHRMTVEYYENTGGALSKFSWTQIPTPHADPYWTASYFKNMALSGSPALVRNESSINFDWGYGSPAANFPADRFSARFVRNLSFQAGKYTFTTTSDDGIRLYVDSQLVIDQWHDMSATVNKVTLNLTAGVHQVQMDYYENGGGAVAKLSWQLVPPYDVGNLISCVRPANSWLKVYRYDNGTWVDQNPNGFGTVSASGYVKIDGLKVVNQNGTGNPYWVELWANGSLIRSVGNTARGEPEFRMYAWQDNYTPWGCPAP